MLKKILLSLEKVFLLSPVILVFSVIFNFHDTKFLISRAIVIVSFYCLFFYRNTIVNEFKSKLRVILFGLAACSYFFFMQFMNEGNSDLPRSILFVLIYYSVIPNALFSKSTLFYLASLGCASSGILAIYETYWLGVDRVGYLTLNPIPFAYYSGLSLIVMLGSLGSTSLGNVGKFKLVCVSSCLPLAVCAVVLSQTRATYLSILIVSVMYLIFLVNKKPSKKNVASTLILFLSISTLLWQVDDIRLRVVDAFNQVQNFSHNDYYSSTGMRVKLWETGLIISQDSFFVGHSKSDISEKTTKLIDAGEVPSYLKQFLVHPNPNFHNQFIQALVDSGLIGLVLILTFILLPAMATSCSIKSLGVFVSIYTAICLFFDSMFLYNHTLILFAFLLLIFYAISIKESGKGGTK